MAVIIGEVLVKGTVKAPQESGKSKPNQDQIVQQCVNQVMTMLKDRQER